MFSSFLMLEHIDSLMLSITIGSIGIAILIFLLERRNELENEFGGQSKEVFVSLNNLSRRWEEPPFIILPNNLFSIILNAGRTCISYTNISPLIWCTAILICFSIGIGLFSIITLGDEAFEYHRRVFSSAELGFLAGLLAAMLGTKYGANGK